MNLYLILDRYGKAVGTVTSSPRPFLLALANDLGLDSVGISRKKLVGEDSRPVAGEVYTLYHTESRAVYGYAIRVLEL